VHDFPDSGRSHRFPLTSQAVSHVLNWQPGDRLTLTAGAGVVVVACAILMAWSQGRPGTRS
jgi:hypothetical protein